MTPSRNLGLYIHVPFCRTRCHFCAFYLELYRVDSADTFVSSLLREIELYAARDLFEGDAFSSVYFGGGTPTMLSTDQLCRILTALRQSFPIQQDAEISIEAHPDTVSPEGLTILREAGFNRLSLGIESTDGEELMRVGRPTTMRASQMAVTAARQADFSNLSLDLIYGLPGQTTNSWRTTLHEAITWNPAHLSCYALTVEDNTRLQADVRRGIQPTADPDLQNEMERITERCLAAAGYEQYEISNYAQPGFACRHNLLYWTDGEYLGLGPSAQSYLNGSRFGDIDDLKAYSERLARGKLPIQEQVQLSLEQRQREAVVFGLRLLRGVPRGLCHPDEWDSRLRPLLERHMIELTTERVRLTPLGRRYADSVAVALL